MKGKIDCELYSPSEENKFEEFSFFPAEDYKIHELKNDSKENFKVDELFQGEEPTKQVEKKIDVYDQVMLNWDRFIEWLYHELYYKFSYKED